MSRRNTLLGSAVSFAHLQGISKPLGRKSAEKPDDEKTDDEKEDDAAWRKQGENEPDDEYEKRIQDADEAKDDANDDDDDEKDAKASDTDTDEDMEADEPDDGKEKDQKSKAARARGMKAERARWASVLGHKSFAGNPALAARLLATTGMSSKAILGVLRDSPAASSPALAARAASNPNVGPNGGGSPLTVAAANDARWSAAFKRAGIGK